MGLAKIVSLQRDCMETSMKRMILIAFAAIAVMGSLQTAEARKITLSSKTTLSQLKAICDSMGGSFWSNDNGYSCVRSNCDGKGNTCSVACDADGNCVGFVPKKIPPQTKDLRGILNPPITKGQ